MKNAVVSLWCRVSCRVSCRAETGAVGAFFGGANMLLGAFRVTYGGALAMAITIGVGFLSVTLNISEMSYSDE